MSGADAIDLVRFVSEPAPCTYLRDKVACLEYRIPVNLTARRFGELLRRGWRRFGTYVFRPRCPACRECRSIRVPVATFRPSKSQRRSFQRNTHIEISIGPPQVTRAHVELFNDYHRDMSLRRGWPANSTSPSDYFEGFIGDRFEFAREVTYRHAGRLVGVGLIDVVDDALSSVYFYHAPQWRNLGPGTFSALTEIEFARQTGLPYVYLGYWVAGNQSMNYKARFRPHELLAAQVEENAEPTWLPVDDASTP